MKNPEVAIVMGSTSDLPTMKKTSKLLAEFAIRHEIRVLSAHRSPRAVIDFSQQAVSRGIKVVIAAAGGAAHLAGVIAAHTTLPVIGVPMETRALKGIDSLLSTVQMPSGVPVATLAIGQTGAKNAAILAAEILSLGNSRLRLKLHNYKRKLARAARKIK